MKKEFLIPLTGAALLTTTLFTGTSVFAAENNASSNASVGFEAGTDSSKPLDPTNPDREDDPQNPIDTEDPNNGGTNATGPKRIDYVSNLKFGINKVSGKTQTYNAKNVKPRIQVSDTSGTSSGWTVTVAASPFTAQKDSKTETLRGAELSFQNYVAKKPTENNAASPTAHNVTLNNGDAQVFATAAPETGEGTHLLVGENATDSQLKVLGGTAKSLSYTSTLTWTISDAPLPAPQ